MKKRSLIIQDDIAIVPLTQGKVAYVDAHYAIIVQQHNWCAIRKKHLWYAGRRSAGTTQYLHQLITGRNDTDHINGDGLDNRQANLRSAARSQNGHNHGPLRNNKTGYKGVSKTKSGKFVACICIYASVRYLGHFDTAEEAARGYDAAALELVGKFAWTNFGKTEVS